MIVILHPTPSSYVVVFLSFISRNSVSNEYEDKHATILHPSSFIPHPSSFSLAVLHYDDAVGECVREFVVMRDHDDS